MMAIRGSVSDPNRFDDSADGQMLLAIERELLIARVTRRSANGKVTLVLRIFSVLLLLGLLAAGLGAMWYLQSLASQREPVTSDVAPTVHR